MSKITDKEKLEKIKELVDTEYPKYICGCYLVQQIGIIVEAKYKSKG